MIATNVRTQISNFVKANLLTLNNTLRVYNSVGEVARKTPANVQYITSSLTQYTFYLNEEEAKNTTIISIKLFDATGSEVASQTLSRVKGYPESLLIVWTLEVV